MANKFLKSESRFRIWAHQGGEHIGPPSTIWTIRRALNMGANAVELDVHASKDGIVVHHDDNLLRATGEDVVISLAEVREMKRHDPGRFAVAGRGIVHGLDESQYRFRDKHHEPEHQVATLDEVFDLLKDKDVLISLDLKDKGYVTQVIDLIKKYGLEDRVIAGSFSDSTVAEIKKIDPSIQTYPGRFEVVRFALNPWGVASSMNHHALMIPRVLRVSTTQLIAEGRELQRERGATPLLESLKPLLDSEDAFYMGKKTEAPPRVLRFSFQPFHVKAAQKRGKAVHFWTIDDGPEMDRLIAWGADGLVTNDPGLAVARYAARNTRRGKGPAGRVIHLLS